MTTSLDHPATAASTSAQPLPGGRRKPLRRKRRIVGAVALALTGVLLASTATNLVLERVEQARITPYGHRIEIDGGALNVFQNGHSGAPIVLLSGLGTAAPALDFAPLIRELSGYSVTVVEGFGYGYSDMSAGPRTVENISTELHEVLSRLDIEQPYTLIGHSIAGFYTLDYANRYPKEVSAVVGIDPTVAAGKADTAAPPTGGVNWLRVFSSTGVVRGINSLVPALAEPDGDAYTASERDRIRLMTSWNFGNSAVTDETRRIAVNARALQGMTYPDDVPVLTFLSEASIATMPHWRELHEDQLRNVKHHELIVLDGGHYLHWTQSTAMASKITGFLGQP
jgi:pimeloyl-ACP methyl ester carboxylesterase